MAAGSRTKYALDLNDAIAFPDGAHVPAFPPDEGESWIILLEIVRDTSVARPSYQTRCKIGVPFVVTLYTETPLKDRDDLRYCSPGNVLCLTSARPKTFLDGSTGFRVEDASTIQALPVSLDQLKKINKDLCERSDKGQLEMCYNCNKPAQNKCAGCRARYCSKDCQKAHWHAGHKRECKAVKALHVWNRTDWG